MNSLQLLITGNSSYHPDESQHTRSDHSSKTDYDLFLKILSFLEPKDMRYSKFVSQLWCKAVTQTLRFECPLLEKLTPELIINVIDGEKNNEIIPHMMPMENNDNKLYQIGNRLDGIQNDLKLLTLCKAQIKESNYENAIILSNNVLTMKLKMLIHEEVDLAIWKDSKELAEIGQIEEAFKTASKIHDGETRELAIQDIYDSEQGI